MLTHDKYVQFSNAPALISYTSSKTTLLNLVQLLNVLFSIILTFYGT